MKQPTPDQIRAKRNEHHLTQTQAAALVHTKLRRWQSWEQGEHTMHPALWELFTIKVARPVAYLHTMRMEGGQSRAVATVEGANPFGEPGRDYSETFKVTTTPLFDIKVKQ